MARRYDCTVSAADIIRESESLTMKEKLAVMRRWLAQLGEDDRQRKTVERLLRRLEHPEVPEEIWEGFEQCEDGQALEIKDEHFANPPV
jgi:hypothetical protein